MTKQTNIVADVNILRVLRFIWQHKDASRIKVASELGLDKSTVSKITSKLVDLGIVEEASLGDSGVQGGRRPVFLKIKGNYACVGGIEINPERFVCCLIDLNGTVLFQWQEDISPQRYKELGCKGIFFKAYEFISDTAKRLNISLVGLGVGVPGMVDSSAGKIVQSVSLMIENPYDFIEDISSEIDIPVYLENDARCCCFGEKLLVKDESILNMLFVLTEYRVIQPKSSSKKNLSVGMGLVLNGNMYRGQEESAGEFRSMLWDGGVGQFSSLVVSSDSSDFNNGSLEMVFHELARHIAFLVNILNLDEVYIGGLGKDLTDRIVALVQECTENQWPYGIPRKYKIKADSLGDFSVAYGAAAMVVEDFFSLPNLSGSPKKISFIMEQLRC